MRKLFAAVVIIAVAVIAVASFVSGNSTATAGGGPSFKATLLGENEVPPVVTDTKGKARINFNRDMTSAEIRLEVRNGERVTQSHIHCGTEGLNGPVVVFLAGFHDRGWDVDGKWIDNASFTGANIIPRPDSAACPGGVSNLEDLIMKLKNGGAYVNVHTIANPPGEIRGQLLMVGVDDDDGNDD